MKVSATAGRHNRLGVWVLRGPARLADNGGRRAGPLRPVRLMQALSLAAAMTIFGLGSPAVQTAHAASNTPATGSQIFGPYCGNYPPVWGGFEADGTVPNWVLSGDYSGPVSYGVSSSPTCTYGTGYVLDKTGSPTTTFQWFYGATGSGQSPDLRGRVCSVWAYVPTVDAGDRDARYDVWGGYTGEPASNWLFWPGQNIDQENTSGWIYLGSHTMGGNDWIMVTLNNTDNSNPGWYTGAGAMAFSCVPPSAPPPVPASVTATATSPNTIHVSWTDNAGGNAQDIVTDGPTNTAALPYGSTSSDWIGLVPGTYRCSAVEAGNPAGWSAWSPWACATTPVPVATNVKSAATSPTSIKLTWTDNTGGYSQYLVTDGSGDYSPTLPAGTTSYTWTAGLKSNTYKCLTVQAEGPNANSGWSAYACATTPWSETDARNDLLRQLAAPPIQLETGLHDSAGHTMDAPKVIQIGPSQYLAAYHANSQVMLAVSTDLVNWNFDTVLDTSATQAYIAEASNGSFVLADEKFDTPGATGGNSHLHFLHYPSLAALEVAQPDKTFTPPGPRLFSLCNEGTPDIHGLSADGLTMGVGFHWNANCLNGLDQEAFGTLTDFNSMTATEDTVRDTAIDNIGYGGKHGGRDDISWHGWRFSLQEAQCDGQVLAPPAECQASNSDENIGDNLNWRYILYDYTDQQAYPAPITPQLGSAAYCHGNPKIRSITDPGGNSVLVITGFIFGPPNGCVPSGSIAGDFLYTVPAT